jgi:hypothetical protein
MNNGKGSKPRNNFSCKFRENYETINWGHPPKRYWEESLQCDKLDQEEGCAKCGADTLDSCEELKKDNNL